MSQVINTNISSLNAQRQLNRSQMFQQTAMERLSSGLRINSAKDDAAGLAISDRMTAQIRGLNQAIRNANDGSSIAQVAEGSLGEITNALQRMRELAVQSANDTNTATDRVSLQKEVAQLQQEITRVATQTQFNGKNLLDGTFTSQKFQIGAYANQTISFSIGSSKADAIGNNTASTGVGDGSITEAVAGSAVNNVAAQSLSITGPVGTKSGISIDANATARDVASAINAETASTGVKATAETTATLSNLTTAGTLSFDLYGSNSSAVSISVAVANTSDLSALADAINNKASSTGVTAELSTDKQSITLKNDEGYDIRIDNFTHSGGSATDSIDFTGADTGAAAVTLDDGTTATQATVGGQVSLSASGNFSVTSDDAGNTLFDAATTNSSLSSVADLDIGTQAGANSAIDTLDGALAFVDDLRATLGAVQNRFSSAVANMETTSQNVSAARSRVRDADFAAETAELSRNQILQQAGTAMLAQANASTQNVLSLLRG